MTAINKNQFAFIDTGKYVSGQATKVFVSMPFPQHKEAVYKEVTLAEPINNGDTFITITEPLDVTLYEWTKLRLVPLVSEIDENAFGVFVFIETPAGETVIPIHPANGTAPAGKVFRLTSYIPVFSAKSVNIDNQSTMFIENNFSDLDIKTALTGVSASGTIEGAFIFGDPGNAIIQNAIKTAKMVQLEVVTSDRKTSDTARVFLSANKQKGVNAFNTISYAWFADRMASENILTRVMESEFGLSVDKTLVGNGDTFTVTFVGDESASYTITGVESADIGGAPLTGTFTASGEQLTFTVVNGDKNFVLSLDNGKASVEVEFILPEHIESFSFSSGSPVETFVWWDFTWTTTNPLVPNNAQIYLVSAFFDSYGDIGTYSAPESSPGFSYSGPEILVGTGRSISGRVIEKDVASFTTNSSASASATLKFVW